MKGNHYFPFFFNGIAICNVHHCHECAGIGITIVPGIKALDISVDMPVIFRNQTTGLMGNFNSIQSDDFILPNGTVLPSNMTDRQKFEDFGSHCKLLLPCSLSLSPPPIHIYIAYILEGKRTRSFTYTTSQTSAAEKFMIFKVFCLLVYLKTLRKSNLPSY